MYTKVVADRETKRSRWFWFILFATNEDAATALEKANGAIIQLPWEEFAPREIRLMYAEAKEESENSNSWHDNQENNSESDDVISSQNDDDSEWKDEDESDEE